MNGSHWLVPTKADVATFASHILALQVDPNYWFSNHVLWIPGGPTGKGLKVPVPSTRATLLCFISHFGIP